MQAEKQTERPSDGRLGKSHHLRYLEWCRASFKQGTAVLNCPRVNIRYPSLPVLPVSRGTTQFRAALKCSLGRSSLRAHTLGSSRPHAPRLSSSRYGEQSDLQFGARDRAAGDARVGRLIERSVEYEMVYVDVVNAAIPRHDVVRCRLSETGFEHDQKRAGHSKPSACGPVTSKDIKRVRCDAYRLRANSAACRRAPSITASIAGASLLSQGEVVVDLRTGNYAQKISC
ncbi:hypothetical protein EDB86DRAFT_2975225 [Lactarius hatsudake]|nr:hypothetical protein EDB86DRAFT_2975225 [Lactarius hatsudake]